MTVEWASINNHQVARDHDLTWRWFDAVGASAARWQLTHRDVVSTTTAAGQIVTATNGTLVATNDVTGGAVTLTVAGNDNDLITVQGHSEAFRFASRWPAYYGCKFRLVDADQTDFFAGFCIADTTLEGGLSDGIYFRLVDQSAVLSLVLEQDSAETTVEVATLADATDYTLEMHIDGDYVYAYINGALAASVATSNANFCNDEDLAGTFGIQAGAAAANNARLYWARALQVQET
jgi:hypothetical protein